MLEYEYSQIARHRCGGWATGDPAVAATGAGGPPEVCYLGSRLLKSGLMRADCTCILTCLECSFFGRGLDKLLHKGEIFSDIKEQYGRIDLKSHSLLL